MAPNTQDDLDTSAIGEFQADKIDDVSSDKITKMVPCVGIYSRGYVLQKSGTWHLGRKKAILKDHPEVKQLYGQNPPTLICLFFTFLFHIYLASHFSQYSWFAILLGSYTVGGWMSFILQVIGHEGTHRLVSKTPAINKLTALIAFLPVFNGPFGTLWMYEHMWHHNVVVDKSLRYGLQSNSTIKKAILTLIFIGIVNFVMTLSGLILGITMLVTIPLGIIGLRDSKYPKKFPLAPYNRFPQTLNGWTFANIIACIAFNLIMLYFTGIKGFSYLALSALFMNGLHPLGMRQVQEHYFVKRGQPTYSVYSPIHQLTMNLGFHVEHHDFATVPWNRLPQLTELAPEYYNEKALYAYKSYNHVLVQFLFNPGMKLSDLFDVEIQTPYGPLPPAPAPVSS